MYDFGPASFFSILPALLDDLLKRLDILRYLLRPLEREIPPLPLNHDIRHRINPITRLLANQHLNILQPFILVLDKRFRISLRNAGRRCRFQKGSFRRGMLLVLEILRVQRYHTPSAISSPPTSLSPCLIKAQRKSSLPTVNNLIRNIRPALLLIMLNHPMRIQRIRHRAPELVFNPRRLPVRGHQRGVHVHFFVRVAVFGSFVPGVFVFAGLGGFGVELVGEVFHGEGYGRWGVADEAEGWTVGRGLVRGLVREGGLRDGVIACC